MDEVPRVAHPTAKAFFDALDQYNERREGRNRNDDTDNKKDGAVNKGESTPKGSPSMSSFLRRKSQSLGWRNRHSQNKYYPVTVLQSRTILKSTEEIIPASNDQQRDCGIRPRHFSVLQVQRGEVDGTYGTGATVWPAAMVLIKYLERNSSNCVGKKSDIVGNDMKNDQTFNNDLLVSLQGKHVIDLGAGTGVTSIGAALLGAKSVVCTDGEELVVGLARRNIRWASDQLSVSLCSLESKSPYQRSQTRPEKEMETASSCDIREKPLPTREDGNHDGIYDTMLIDDCPIRAQKYWWGDGTYRNLMSSTEDNGLIILVADCVLPKLYPIAPLVQAIDECLREHDDNNKKGDRRKLLTGPSSSCAILSYEHRYFPDYDPRIEFRRLASERCLDVFTVPRDAMDPIYSLEDVEIWIVRRRHDEYSTAN
mmetsp:Transcript_901/g.1897  ORF Transcript_901/g.1897 Transcript_901/m.1897 type:complete len:425 (+) Transcript_901:142-1416(+)